MVTNSPLSIESVISRSASVPSGKIMPIPSKDRAPFAVAYVTRSVSPFCGRRC